MRQLQHVFRDLYKVMWGFKGFLVIEFSYPSDKLAAATASFDGLSRLSSRILAFMETQMLDSFLNHNFINDVMLDSFSLISKVQRSDLQVQAVQIMLIEKEVLKLLIINMVPELFTLLRPLMLRVSM